MLNSITATGNLGADPKLSYLPTGMVVTNFSIYNTYKYGGGKEDTTIFKVCFFGKQAEFANQFLKSGDLVIVTGRMRLKAFTGRDGVEKTYAEIIGNDFRSLTFRSKEQGYADDSQEEVLEDVDDLPF